MERHAWRSELTGAEMPLRRYGTAGSALLYVPGSAGDDSEFERHGMDRAVERWTEVGRLQVFAVDGWARHNLWNEDLEPAGRLAADARYERYVAEEVLPFVAERSLGRPWIVGCSYGALVASNLLLKRPDELAGACGLGGVYAMWHRLDGHQDDEVYFHTPLEYLPRLDDAAILDSIRRSAGLAIYAAADDPWLWSSERMAELMRTKRLPHTVDIWPSPAGHHERWWREQLGLFVERRALPATEPRR